MSDQRLYSDDELRIALRRARKGTQAQQAKALGISEAYLSDFMAGRRDAGPRILRALGYERVLRYRRVNGGRK